MKSIYGQRWMAPAAGLAAAAVAWQIWAPAAVAQEGRTRLASARTTAARGLPIGEVLVNEDVALRIRFDAGGYSTGERAERVARRLNELSDQGRLRPDRLTTGSMRGQAVVMAGDELIITADWDHARANGTTPHRLAHQWRNNLAVALGGQPIAYREPAGTGFRRTSQTLPGDRVAGTQAFHEEIRTKIVPILSVGSGGSIGVAQVSGPVSRVDEVKAVAQINSDYKDAARIRVMVPIATEKIVSNLRRVPQVSVTGVGALRF